MQKVLQQLLREQVSIRDLGTILETLLDIAPVNKSPVLMVEAARQALSRTVVKPLLSDDGGLRVVTLEPGLEEELNRAYGANATASNVAGLQPSLLRRVIDSLKGVMGEQVAMVSPVLLCSTPARFHLRRLLEPFIPRVVVLSPGEIPPAVNVQSLGVVR